MKRNGEQPAAPFIRMTLALAVAAFMLLGALLPAAAASTTATIGVTARVLARAHLSILRQPASFVVTKQDISRGYVETESVMTEVRSNDSRGCMIILESNGAPVREIMVGVMGRSITSDPSGGMFVLQVLGRQPVAFTFRFMLASDAQPGIYGWPVRLLAQPL